MVNDCLRMSCYPSRSCDKLMQIVLFNNMLPSIILKIIIFKITFISTGTHLLTAIIDASWKVNAYYNGVCMRRGDCYVIKSHKFPWHFFTYRPHL